jgi:hypothetical protein
MRRSSAFTFTRGRPQASWRARVACRRGQGGPKKTERPPGRRLAPPCNSGPHSRWSWLQVHSSAQISQNRTQFSFHQAGCGWVICMWHAGAGGLSARERDLLHMHMGTALQERGNQQAIYTTSAWHYHHQMVIVSGWWAAISQKAPSSDSGL